MKSLNTLFDLNRIVDAAETAQQKFVSYMPESVKTHAEQFTTAQYEFTRAGMATAERMGKIIKTSSEEAVAKMREKFSA